MKHSRILIFAAIAACAALQAGASLNLRLQSTSSNQVELKLSRGEMSDDVDTIKTTGTDPFVQVMPLTRDLDDDEVIFTFEYKSSARADKAFSARFYRKKQRIYTECCVVRGIYARPAFVVILRVESVRSAP